VWIEVLLSDGKRIRSWRSCDKWQRRWYYVLWYAIITHPAGSLHDSDVIRKHVVYHNAVRYFYEKAAPRDKIWRYNFVCVVAIKIWYNITTTTIIIIIIIRTRWETRLQRRRRYYYNVQAIQTYPILYVFITRSHAHAHTLHRDVSADQCKSYDDYDDVNAPPMQQFPIIIMLSI